MVTGSPGRLGNGSFLRVSVLYTCSGGMVPSGDLTTEAQRRQEREFLTQRHGLICRLQTCLSCLLCASVPLWLAFLLDQHSRVAADRLAPADVPDLLARLGLHVDEAHRQPEQPGDVRADSALDRAELRLLGEDRDVE